MFDDEWITQEYPKCKSKRELCDMYNQNFGVNIPYSTFFTYLRKTSLIEPKLPISYDKEWLIANRLNYPNEKELCVAYNKAHGTDIKIKTLKSYLWRNGIKSNKTFFSKEEDDFILENYSKYGVRKTLEMLNEKFGTNRTFYSLRGHCNRLGIQVDSDVRKQNIMLCRSTMDIGEIATHDGYKVIKISNGNGKKKYQKLHRYNYEHSFGKIPSGFQIIFLDGDRSNCSPDNLVAVSRQVIGMLQTNGFRSDCAEVTRTGVEWCKLQIALQNNGYEINK